MAKRKRLLVPDAAFSAGLETKSALPRLSPGPRAPIADVAGEAAGQSALDEVARELTAAREEGRLVQSLPLAQIKTGHLLRDRMVFDAEEMAALQASLQARGQQSPIEVLALPDGGYGLISGLRRVMALRQNGADTVLALIRTPDDSAAAYQAMIEENEIRADLSFYERAHIAFQAAEAGVFANPKAAVKALYAHTAPAKRSKITKFVLLCRHLGDVLTFPAAIPEKLGLDLASAIERDPKRLNSIRAALSSGKAQDVAEERRLLERALKGDRPPAPAAEELVPGVALKAGKGRVTLSGAGVDEALVEALRAFFVARSKK